ncbi:energy-coupling factor transporter ATPase [Bifidobacterium simiarum]|uniref:energy-coupling factor transporter ATPase n=1 Tax=Bifidobacterium simiarum TaxID=2045441 RepID=UPI001BDCABFB|nr:energy-coupling factor transporter ATPase [Bifidobacterium simiarum]MBT1165838.1 ATP-binding cassette domain-containing protein [Bifidobacterium simiarum]
MTDSSPITVTTTNRTDAADRFSAELHDVRFSYDDGASWALDGVDLDIRMGEHVAIVGANGSGKSTLGRLIAGLAAPDAGTVRLMGETVYSPDARADAEAYRRARHEIGAVFQNPEDQIVTTVTADDVAFGPENLGVPRERIGERVDRALAAVDMVGSAEADPTRMSGGQQQRVAIAGMLAMRPGMLVMDEPTAMLDVAARAEVMAVIDRLHAAGTTVVHITHSRDEADRADRIVVMEAGRIVRIESGHRGAGLIDTDRTDDTDRTNDTDQADTSRTDSAQSDSTQSDSDMTGGVETPSDPIITVDHVSFAYPDGTPVIRDRSLTVNRGETIAIVGRNGCGKSTLARLLCALDVPAHGGISVDGIPVAVPRGPHRISHAAKRADLARLRRTVGYVMQHPERQLFADTVGEDVAYGPRNMGLSEADVADRVTESLRLLGIEHLADRSPFALSGGQQRLAAIAGILACRPKILIMDEPTSSLDERASARIHELLGTLRRRGVTVVLITHHADELRLADRVIDLSEAVPSGGEPSDRRYQSDRHPRRSRVRSSFVARLDPRVKMTTFLIMMFTAFAITTPAQLAVAAAIVLAILAAARLSPVKLLHTIRMFLALFAVMWVLNLCFTQSGTMLATIGPLPITDDGLWVATLYFCRLVLVIVLGAVILHTTTPTAMTDAFEALLRPLRRFGMHTDELALVMSLALRFIPTLTAETRSIIDAQSARGGSIETGSPAKRLRAAAAIIIPIFAGTLRHADNLSLALDARSYEGGAHRTHWHRLAVGWRDAAFVAVCLLYVAAIALLPFVA